jgi:hypothetical protein
MVTKTATRTAKPATSAKPVKTAKPAATPKKALTPRRAAKRARPALAKPFTSEEITEIFKLVKGATSVELKLSVPLTGQRATIKAIGLDPVEAQRRHAEPPAVGRESYLVRIIDARHPLLKGAGNRIDVVQIVADRVGDDQRLAIGRRVQVVRFLADGDPG